MDSDDDIDANDDVELDGGDGDEISESGLFDGEDKTDDGGTEHDEVHTRSFCRRMYAAISYIDL